MNFTEPSAPTSAGAQASSGDSTPHQRYVIALFRIRAKLGFPGGTALFMLQVQIASNEFSPIIAYALRGHSGAAVIFAYVATVVANRSKPNELYGTVRPPLHFSVRSSEVALHRLRRTDRNQNVVFANHTDTFPSAERSWLLISGTTGDRFADLR
jgi:hypothetical protein